MRGFHPISLIPRWKPLNAALLAYGLMLAGCSLTTLCAEDWTQIRGPKWRGVSNATGLPTHWDDRHNVRWKTEVPGPGTASPIVWGDNVYVTCFTGYDWPKEHERKRRVGPLKRHLICIDRRTGETRWKQSHTATKYDPDWDLVKSHVRVHGFATNTPACDENGVYVFHGADGVFAYSHDGRPLWKTSVGERYNPTASVSSLILHDGVLYVNANVESGRFVALDTKTGEQVWEINPWHWGHATHIISFEADQPLLILSAGVYIAGHDIKTGKQVWRRPMGEETWVYHSMLTTGDGVIFSCAKHWTKALRGDGSEVLWEKRGGATYPPLIYDAGLVHWVSEGGVVTCQDGKSGERVYVARVPSGGTIYASPIKADGKIYITSREQGVSVISGGREFKLLAHNEFKDDESMFDATPAVAGDCLILRSYRHLYCIGRDGNETHQRE